MNKSKKRADSALKTLLSYTKKERGLLIFIFLAAAISALCEITAPYFTGLAIDRIVGKGNVNFAAVLRYLILLAMLYLVSLILFYFVTALSYRLIHKIVARIRGDVFSKLQKMPLNYYDSHESGDVVSRFVNDATQVADGLIEALTSLFGGLVTVVGTICVMFYLSPVVAVTVLVVTSIVFVVSSLITKYSNKYFKTQQKLLGDLSGFVDETVGAVRTLKAFSYEETAVERFDEINQKLGAEAKRAVFLGSLANPSTRFVNYLAYIAVGVVGITLGGLSAGRISSFIIYSNLFARPFQQITALTTQLLTALASANRLFSVLKEPEEIPDKPDAIRLQNTKGKVEFKDVSFRYTKDRPLIEHFNFTAEPGQKIAIVGPTGAGKTTLVNLIMRFYDVTGGAVLVDDVDVRNLTRKSLRQSIGMVLQETWLFQGTIAQNIAYGTAATKEEIVSAAKAAHADSFIKKLSKGYDTVIGGEHRSLSEGQRQLLTIARAFLHHHPILLLDEATSKVDVLTEHRITRAMSKLMLGGTSFIIAHRLSTIIDADCIIVMRNGHIAEQGAHEELLKKQGFYYELYHSQFKAQED